MFRAMIVRLCMSASVVAFGLTACAEDKSGDQNRVVFNLGPVTDKAAVKVDKAMSTTQLIALLNSGNKAGAELYADFCAACHQEQGQGVGDDFPPLAKNVFVNGDAEEVIYLLLEGRAGMPTFIKDLSTLEMTDVINFIRGSWGNKAPTVTEKEVQTLRDEIEEDDDDYSREGD